MASNTRGYVLVDAGFEDAVSIRAEVHFHMLTQKPFLEIVLMSDVGDFYASEFATNVFIVEDNARLKKPAAKAVQPEYRKPFKDWVQKREPYEFVVTYSKLNEDEKGEIICKLNGVETSRFATDKFRKGKFGFRWSNTKFIIKSLEVQGYVDEEWAKQALEAKAVGGGKSEPTEGFGF